MKQGIKIGVFICHCGSNIAKVVDCKSLTEYAKTLPGVMFAADNLYTCSEAGLREIRDAIGKHGLNRVVVASCSPRTHQPLFQSACKEAGLNPYLFEMVNIRDQCSWVHAGERAKADEKARDLVRMGTAKAAFLRPRQDIESSLIPTALVIGGGIAGLSAAEALADMGLSVILVEKEPELGGLLKNLYRLAPENDSSKTRIENLAKAVIAKPNVETHTSSRVKSIAGYVGNFEIEIERENGESLTQKAGCVIVAAGAEPLRPEGMFGYDGKSVITQAELERAFSDDTFNAANVVMIQCAGARTAGREYCGRICCATAVKNAMIVKEKNPETPVHILYRDMQMYGADYERMLWDARGMGVRFEVYDTKKPPEVRNGIVRFEHSLMGEVREIPCDLAVLSTPLIAREDSPPLARLMKLPLDRYGFFMEAHAKLRPLDFAADGIFVCGSARYPASSAEACSQGLGAASRAATILFREKLVKSAIVAEIDPDTCSGCGECLEVCPYDAISRDSEKGICEINPILCKGCGCCTAACPSQSAGLGGFQHRQLFAQIRAMN